MISVLTLTYKRTRFLEEAVQSFLYQRLDYPHQLVILNDDKDTDYILDQENILIINEKKRFKSLSEKLKFGFSKCKYSHIYRLDDDDLLCPNALRLVCDEIIKNPEYDIYRSKTMHFFDDYKYYGLSGSTNNGNVYTKNYLNNISWPDLNLGEDEEITFKRNAKIFELENPTMIYRWGMETFHLSAYGRVYGEKNLLSVADKILRSRYNHERGEVRLSPRFTRDYYKLINEEKSK